LTAIAIRERVATALVVALRPVLPSGAFERNRNTDVDPSEAPYFVLRDQGHVASYENAGLTSYVMTVVIEGTLAGSGDFSTMANGYYVTIIVALFADPSLGGLCSGIREVSYDFGVVPEDQSSKPWASFGLTLEVDFMTALGDPTVPA
jgi:hypothetical protein